MSDNYEFYEERPAHSYHSQIPHCIDDAELTPDQFRVYCHIKRICGENGKTCFKSQKSLADHCKMSESTLQRCLKALCSENPKLKTPLLRKHDRKKPDGSNDTCVYVIIDVWHINGELYVQKNSGGVRFTPGVVSDLHQGGVTDTDKEKRSKKNSNERSGIPKSKHQKKTNKSNPTENVKNVQNNRTKFSNREIPPFLKFKPLTEKDMQILANQFTDSELVRGIEDAKSYHMNRKKIKNIAAFITQRCKFYRDKA
jgi:hypothetical protein